MDIRKRLRSNRSIGESAGLAQYDRSLRQPFTSVGNCSDASHLEGRDRKLHLYTMFPPTGMIAGLQKLRKRGTVAPYKTIFPGGKDNDSAYTGAPPCELIFDIDQFRAQCP